MRLEITVKFDDDEYTTFRRGHFGSNDGKGHWLDSDGDRPGGKFDAALDLMEAALLADPYAPREYAQGRGDSPLTAHRVKLTEGHGPDGGHHWGAWRERPSWSSHRFKSRRCIVASCDAEQIIEVGSEVEP